MKLIDTFRIPPLLRKMDPSTTACGITDIICLKITVISYWIYRTTDIVLLEITVINQPNIISTAGNFLNLTLLGASPYDFTPVQLYFCNWVLIRASSLSICPKIFKSVGGGRGEGWVDINRFLEEPVCTHMGNPQ